MSKLATIEDQIQDTQPKRAQILCANRDLAQKAEAFIRRFDSARMALWREYRGPGLADLLAARRRLP